MSAPRIEAIALVGSRSQRIYLASRVGVQEQKQQQQAALPGGAEGGIVSARVHNEVLRLEYAAHCALDIVEERSTYTMGSGARSSVSSLRNADDTCLMPSPCSKGQVRGPNGEVSPSSSTYLGLVLTLEDLAVYAMTTSTNLRILVLLCPGEARVRDVDCVTVRVERTASLDMVYLAEAMSVVAAFERLTWTCSPCDSGRFCAPSTHAISRTLAMHSWRCHPADGAMHHPPCLLAKQMHTSRSAVRSLINALLPLEAGDVSHMFTTKVPPCRFQHSHTICILLSAAATEFLLCPCLHIRTVVRAKPASFCPPPF